MRVRLSIQLHGIDTIQDLTCPIILQFLNCCRLVTVLFCSEVAAMGVHCPDLCLGVSIGKAPHQYHHLKHTLSSHRCLDNSLEVCSDCWPCGERHESASCLHHYGREKILCKGEGRYSKNQNGNLRGHLP